MENKTEKSKPVVIKREKSKFTLDELNEFKFQVEHAKQTGGGWVETDAEIIKYLVPQGIAKEKHFIYNGVYVCENGKLEEAQAAVDRDLGKEMHGVSEGTFDGRG